MLGDWSTPSIVFWVINKQFGCLRSRDVKLQNFWYVRKFHVADKRPGVFGRHSASYSSVPSRQDILINFILVRQAPLSTSHPQSRCFQREVLGLSKTAAIFYVLPPNAPKFSVALIFFLPSLSYIPRFLYRQHFNHFFWRWMSSTKMFESQIECTCSQSCRCS